MRRRSLLLTCLVALCPSVFASADEEGESISVSVDATVASRYQWRGLVLSDGAVFQPSIDLAFRGWSLNFWGSMELSDANSYDDLGTGRNRITEWNTTLSYVHEFSAGSLTFGVTYYDYPNTGYHASTEVFGIWERPGDIGTSIEAYYDIDEVKGLYLRFSAEKVWGVSGGLDKRETPSTFSLRAGFGFGSAGYNNVYFGEDRFGVVDFGVTGTFEVEVSERASLRFFAIYETLVDRKFNAGLPNRSHLGVGMGFGYQF